MPMSENFKETVEKAVNHQSAIHINTLFNECLAEHIKVMQASNGIPDLSFKHNQEQKIARSLDLILGTRDMLLSALEDKICSGSAEHKVPEIALNPRSGT